MAHFPNVRILLALLTVLTFAAVMVCGTARAEVVAAHAGAVITDPAYGAVPDDGQDDTGAIQRALDAVRDGGTLVVPAGTFTAGMAKGLKVTKKRISIIFEGNLEVITEGRESPESRNLFTVTGEGCRFIGRGGMICGVGEPFRGGKNPTVHRVLQYPALIYFTHPAHNGVVTGLHLRNPPGIHVAFVGVEDCKLTNCTLDGGTKPVDHEKTKAQNPIGPWSRYFGVFFVGTSGLMIQGNHFKTYEGRCMYQWIQSSGSGRHPGTSIVGNVFEGAYDHAVYCSGIIRSVVANNTTRNIRSVAIKLIGEDLVVTGNNVYNSTYGGISTRCGSRCIIANNLVLGFGHRAISISPYGGGTRAKQAYTDNVVRGNILIGQTASKDLPVMSAIRIESRDMVSRCKVEGNIIHNTGTGNSALDPKRPGEAAIGVIAGKASTSVTVIGNTIHNARAAGIHIRNLRQSIITHNIIHSKGEAIVQEGCKDNIVDGNLTTKAE